MGLSVILLGRVTLLRETIVRLELVGDSLELSNGPVVDICAVFLLCVNELSELNWVEAFICNLLC